MEELLSEFDAVPQERQAVKEQLVFLGTNFQKSAR
jgi:hypothetical protein